MSCPGQPHHYLKFYYSGVIVRRFGHYRVFVDVVDIQLCREPLRRVVTPGNLILSHCCGYLEDWSFNKKSFILQAVWNLTLNMNSAKLANQNDTKHDYCIINSLQYDILIVYPGTFLLFGLYVL